jgi:YD repeat-containing protein
VFRKSGRNTIGRVVSLGLGMALALTAASTFADAANGGVVYTYDALGRVTSASYDTGVIIMYTYDANGNRFSQAINVNTATLTWTATSAPCTSNCWGTGLWQ